MDKTLVVQIGNSDDKLTQVEWGNFVEDLRRLAADWGQTHFFGFGEPGKPWQNCCLVVEVSFFVNQESIRMELADLTLKYRQDSIAVSFCKTEFIRP